jgi:hypothetical protein
MSSGRYSFKQTDLQRALRAAKAEDVPVDIVVEKGRMTIKVTKDGKAAVGNGEGKDEVESWIQKHAHRS